MSNPHEHEHYAYVVGPPYAISLISFTALGIAACIDKYLTSLEPFAEDANAVVELAGVVGGMEEHRARMISFATQNIIDLDLCSIPTLNRYRDIAEIWSTREDVIGVGDIIASKVDLPTAGGPVPMIAKFGQLPKWDGADYDRDLTRALELARRGAEVEEAFLTVCHAWYEPPGPSPFSTRTSEERAIIVTATLDQIALYLSEQYLVGTILPLEEWERTGRGQVIRHLLLICERKHGEHYT